MKKALSVFSMAALSAVVLTLGTGASGGGSLRFRAKLTGDQLVPPVETMAMGEATVEFARDFSYAKIRLDVHRGERITQAHIHCGAAGANGPVVVFLAGFHDRGWDLNGPWVRATVTDDNIVNDSCGTTLKELATAMMAGDTYVNVHSVAHPPGEIRGQLRRVGGGNGNGNDDDDDDDDGDDE